MVNAYSNLEDSVHLVHLAKTVQTLLRYSSIVISIESMAIPHGIHLNQMLFVAGNTYKNGKVLSFCVFSSVLFTAVYCLPIEVN